MTTRNIAWQFFAVSILSAWFFSEFGWMLGWYFSGMNALGVLTICVAIWALSFVPRKPITVLLVGIGLIIGNWRILENWVILLFWSIQGFADLTNNHGTK